jgi:2-polyprenyl-6-hydroxyphenyl methylase/3-demethylubiquinone-9 3-methyltransferase
MQESDIRPAHLLSNQKEVYQLDLNRYRALLHKFESRACPGCGENTTTNFVMHHDFTFVRCISCQCVFMNPGPTELHVSDLYANSQIYKFWAEYMYPQSRESRLATLHKIRVEWLIEAIDNFAESKEIYRILEVGAGTGDTLFSLNSLNRSDIETFAVEWNPDMKQSLATNQIHFLGKTIDEINPEDQKFDLIVLFEVIEHMLNPMVFLESAKKLLNPNGLLMFTTPNSQSLEVQWMKERTSTIDIEHITLLSPASVTHLAMRNSFRVKEIKTDGKLDAELLKKSGCDLRIEVDSSPVSSEGIQELISEGGFSSNMQVIFQK